MCKKAFQKLCISFFVILSIILCSCISAFAYHPVISIKSSDWKIESDYTYSAVYPNKLDDNYLHNDKFYQYSELNGETYYGSRLWDEEYPYIDSVAVNVPAFPNGESMAFGEPYNNFDTVVFRLGAKLYLAMLYGYNKVYLNNQNYFLVDINGCTGEIDFFEFTYPYSSWVFHSYVDYYGSSSTADFIEGVNAHQAVEIVWSSIDVYANDMETVIHDADGFEFQGTSYTIEYPTNIAVLSGSLSFVVDSDVVSKLSFGSFAFVMNNFGFICGMQDTNILCYSYGLTIRQGGDYRGSTELASFSFDSRIDEPLALGKSYIDNFFEVLDYNSDMSQDIEFLFSYTFVSDNYQLYFPGSIEFIEFESYEDDMEHDEVMNAIDEAAGLIDGSIKNASSELSQEIASAADSIVSNSNENTAIVTSKIDESTKNITDKLQDVGDKVENKLEDVKDGITEKLEDTKNGILDGIKSFFIPSDEVMEEIDNKWDELLKSRFGALYEVSDIITDFASQMSWDYIKEAGEKNTITMPSVTVKLVDTDFTFGGYEVSIIPEGFDVLTTALKGITSIVCTLLFVNALRRKYDKLVGGTAA